MSMPNETGAGKRPLPVDPAEFRPDPHAGFARYRPMAGVLAIGTGAFPTIVRYADILALMSDEHTRQMGTEALAFRGVTSGSLHSFYANSLLMSNPPRHAPRRAPLARTFAFRMIQDLRPHIRALADRLIDGLAGRGGADFLADFAAPRPARG
jgi:cytochrome P450